MANMKPPKIADDPPAVLTDDQLIRLLKACEGKQHAERRDTAIIRLLLDTGMRRHELATLKLTDIDFDTNVAIANDSSIHSSSPIVSRPRLQQRSSSPLMMLT